MRSPLAALLNKERKGAVRLLGFVNHTNIGDYRVQNQAALFARAHDTPDATPVITDHP